MLRRYFCGESSAICWQISRANAFAVGQVNDFHDDLVSTAAGMNSKHRTLIDYNNKGQLDYYLETGHTADTLTYQRAWDAKSFADAYNNLVRSVKNYKAQEVKGGLGKGGRLGVGQ